MYIDGFIDYQSQEPITINNQSKIPDALSK